MCEGISESTTLLAAPPLYFIAKVEILVDIRWRRELRSSSFARLPCKCFSMVVVGSF